MHDNFDAMHIGKQPKDIGISDYDNWDDIPDEVATVKKTVCVAVNHISHPLGIHEQMLYGSYS